MNSKRATSDAPLAIITGASGGIGLSIASELAARGFDLLLLARSEPSLSEACARIEQTSGVSATYRAMDLSKLTESDQLFGALEQHELSRLNVFVNNAGYALFGPADELSEESQLNMLDLNCRTLYALTLGAARVMKANQGGKIMNVASTAAFMPGPLMSGYYASKAFVLSLSEGINEELKGTGVKVMALCPGPTESGFQQRAAMQNSKLVKGRQLMTSTEVAKQGVAELLSDYERAVFIPGWFNRIQALTPRILPRSLVPRMVLNAQRASEH